MKFDKISNFYNGWIVGDFEPSLITNSPVTVGILQCEKNHKADGHFHKLHTEYNVIISGKALIDGVIYTNGDVFIYEPMDKANVIYLEDTILVVIKYPSIKGDKYE
jgi:hypothetical protein